MAHPLVLHWGRPGSLPVHLLFWFSLVRAGTPGCTPLNIILPSCLCVCGRVCTCAPLQGTEVYLVIEARCCVCWGGRSFCLVLPLSTLPLGQCTVGAFPTPTLPAQLLLLPCTPRLVGKAAGEDSEQQHVGGVTRQPSGTPQSGLLKVPGWAPRRG